MQSYQTGDMKGKILRPSNIAKVKSGIVVTA